MSNSIAKNKKIGYIVGICLSALLILLAFCGRYFDGALCKIGNFLLGSFGISFYGIAVAVIVGCSLALSGKKITVPSKYIVHFVLTFVAVVLLVHMIPTFFFGITKGSYSEYVSYVYHYYDTPLTGIPTFGGVVFGTVAFLLSKVITVWGAMIICLLLLAWNVIVLGEFFYSYATGKIRLTKQDVESVTEKVIAPAPVAEQQVDNQRQKAMELLFNQEVSIHPEEVSVKPETHFESAPQSQIEQPSVVPTHEPTAEEILFGNDEVKINSFFNKNFADNSHVEENQTPVDDNTTTNYNVKGFFSADSATLQKDDTIPTDWLVDSSSQPQTEVSANDTQEDVLQSDFGDNEQILQQQPQPVEPVNEQYIDESNVQPSFDDVDNVAQESSTDTAQQNVNDEFAQTIDVADLTVEQMNEIAQPVQEQQEEQVVDDTPKPSPDEIVAIEMETPTDGGFQMGFDFRTREELEQSQAKMHNYAPYIAPELELLDDAIITVDQDADDRRHCAQAIVDKLRAFKVDVEFYKAIAGPAFTQYQFDLVSTTHMTDLARYSEDIKGCVESQSPVRIEAPIPGTNKIGVEIENKHKSTVKLRTLLASDTFQNAKGSLMFVVGKRITGEVIVKDLAKTPHLLVAGSTGSGKSVCLNTMIVSLMYKYGPEYLRFIMVDPKLVEFSRYDGIPHMLLSETITKVSDALAAMDYLINEMENRYLLFKQSRVTNISEYNKYVNTKLNSKLPYLVFIVDELSDILADSKSAFEAKLVKLTQKARAAGIHLVLATQHPDVKTISGTIKANLPSRIAFKVVTPIDSGVILGKGGAEKLLGSGDLLYMSSDSAELVRMQGAYIGEQEIRRVVDSAIASNETYFDPKIEEQIHVKEQVNDDEQEMDKDEKFDPYCKRALRYWLDSNAGKASISSLTRGLSIGFNRAGRIVAQLQDLKYIEKPLPSESNSKPVKVLVTLDQLDELFPDMEG